MSGAVFQFPELRSHDPGSLGGFRLAARLGEGGMGQVFLAFSPGGQPAAVKVIREEFARDVEFGQRFAREVAAAQKVRGAHLAPLLDADPRAGRPWLATMYVAGPSLRELVAGQGPLPAGQVMLLAWGIAHALADIHAAGVVHRDLKPGNIILDETGPKVIDFGIVKSLAQSVTYTSSSTRIGTPLYMSPEQAAGRAVGAACDVFALGSTLYFLATGREAFAAENEWAVAHRVVADEPDVSAIAPPLRQLITVCLRKDPAQRPTPTGVRESCEAELGNALGPGAWMGIAGAREAIRQRTSALHTLTAPGIPAPTPEGGVALAPDSRGPGRGNRGTPAIPAPDLPAESAGNLAAKAAFVPRPAKAGPAHAHAPGGEPVAITSDRATTVLHRAHEVASIPGALVGLAGAGISALLKQQVLTFLAVNPKTSWPVYLFSAYLAVGAVSYALVWLIVVSQARSAQLDSLTVSPDGMTTTHAKHTSHVHKWNDLAGVWLSSTNGEVVVTVTTRGHPAFDALGNIVVFRGVGITAADTARLTTALHKYAGNLYQGPVHLRA
ncbi:hypothetical protein GCM10009665_42140 [Kitasatospora nipponensis]|uniref:Protein kinase domain-containing protein n=1 Tax=Kitasatospora nipponensis TaxID=258049 RepID=A0ABP4H1N2_9ACTN